MDKTLTTKNIKQNLKTLRASHKLSQKEAAKAFGVSISAYQKYELNGPITPSLPVLIRIADYYKITIDDLLGRQIQEEPEKKLNTTLTEILMQNMQTISSKSKDEINDILLKTFKYWSNKNEAEQKLMNTDNKTDNRKTVYVNFENATPHSKYMDGVYDKQESHLFFEIPSSVGNIVTYMAAGDYEINWTDKYGNHHTEYLTAGSEYFFPSDIVTDEPKF